ncbi:hypothetical protein HNQ94_001752 [Salirhabdus euzebyi]|uniref:WbqC-like protein family protein n=1 Tax=Salirhabdus euzebyi TaxID=394506 RepID=A0A841Q4I1_9BACI|nr:WbqC family protein [Salirhabdus euzebyi]MBB6453304.1 hypothetical protein [Salirhabdus euzebyi]
MIVSIHQPNLFPWLGFFDKMAHSDMMILLDTVPFRKRSYQNRVKIKTPNGAQWLTVPVETKGKFAQLTKDVKVSDTINWKEDHQKMFQLFYSRSDHFDELFPQLESLYEEFHGDKLIDFTIPGIEWTKKQLGIETPLVTASSLGVNGKKSELLSDLVKSVGGTTYLSGPTGKDYLEHDIFAEKGIQVDYHSFSIFEYPQLFNAFEGGLSTIDYLFNVKRNTPWNGGE